MKKAFSLIELMIVVVILGLIATLVVPNLIGKADEAKVKLTCVNLFSLAKAIDLFKIDIGHYPTNEEGLQSLISNPSNDNRAPANYPKNGHLSKNTKLTDAWGSQIIYLYDESTQSFDLVSLGADKKESEDDIVLSQCQK